MPSPSLVEVPRSGLVRGVRVATITGHDIGWIREFDKEEILSLIDSSYEITGIVVRSEPFIWFGRFSFNSLVEYTSIVSTYIGIRNPALTSDDRNAGHWSRMIILACYSTHLFSANTLLCPFSHRYRKHSTPKFSVRINKLLCMHVLYIIFLKSKSCKTAAYLNSHHGASRANEKDV